MSAVFNFFGESILINHFLILSSVIFLLGIIGIFFKS